MWKCDINNVNCSFCTAQTLPTCLTVRREPETLTLLNLLGFYSTVSLENDRSMREHLMIDGHNDEC